MMADSEFKKLALQLLASVEKHESLLSQLDDSNIALPGNLFAARNEVWNLTAQLQNILRAPVDVVNRNEDHHVQLSALRTIYRFKVAKNVPEDSGISYHELSKLCGLNQSVLQRVVRYLMTFRMFEEPEPGFVKHTGASLALTTSTGLENMLGFLSEDMFPSAVNMVDALLKWPAAEEPNETGFNIAMNTPESMYENLGKDPVRGMRIGNAMGFFATMPTSDPLPLLSSPPFQKILEAPHFTLVDIGGGTGVIDNFLLDRSPGLNCIVQDMPAVVEQCQVPPVYTGRLQFSPHNFFEDQPVIGADAYFMRQILHNWSNKYAANILQKLIPALKDGSKILLQEYCIPEPGSGDISRERYIRCYDIAMLGAFNGQERSEAEFIDLFSSVDSRFKLDHVYSTPDSYMSLIEFTWHADR